VDIGYCILDAAYFYFYLARRVLLCCAKSIGNNFSLFFHLPQVGFKVFQAARARGQPTRIKIIFKVRTFEVGPLLISQMQRLLVYRFRFAFLDAEMLRDEVACNGRAMSRRFLNALSHDCQQSNIQQQLEQCLVQWLGDHYNSK